MTNTPQHIPPTEEELDAFEFIYAPRNSQTSVDRRLILRLITEVRG